MYEKQIEKIPGFEITPDLHKIKACAEIYNIAGLKTMNMKKEVAGALKKLLDDRRRLTGLCLAMFRIFFLSHLNNNSILKSDCIRILKKVTGKTIDELIDYE